VTVVVATSGAFTHNEKLAAELKKPVEERDPAIINEPPDKYAAEKAEELRNAAALFGVTDIRILPGPQPFIANGSPEIAQQISEIILEVRPHVLVTQSPYLHGAGTRGRSSGYLGDDHIQTAFAVQDAQYLANSPRPGARHAPHRIAATLYPGVYFSSEEWDFAVDITDWYDQRVAAENFFKSQGHWDAWSNKRMEVSLGNAGWFSGTGYAEGWVRASTELLPRITISPFTLRDAVESPRVHMERLVGSPPPE
jgi:LmbE family N-acetylglucosaminyl deacetylase